jgi:uncharacterized protein (DUF433 family)
MDPLLSRSTIDPAICHGSPSVRGLRYPVEMLLELLSSGMTFDEILADYEDLERDDLAPSWPTRLDSPARAGFNRWGREPPRGRPVASQSSRVVWLDIVPTVPPLRATP